MNNFTRSPSPVENSFILNNEVYRISPSTSVSDLTTLNENIILSLSDNLLAIHVLFYNSIDVISSRLKVFNFKVTAFKVDLNSESAAEDLTAETTNDTHLGSDFPTEIAVMNDLEHKFKFQNDFGRLYSKNEYVIFRSKIPVTENIGLRLDLYQNKPRIDQPERYEKVAFCHIYPLDYKESNGIFTLPITSKAGKIIARVKAEYFIAKPFELDVICKAKTKTRSPKSWTLKKEGLDIGHRGLGQHFRNDAQEKFLENTVDSFNFAYKKGADMVELDVQLSKDKVPIVYHDFNVNLVLQKRDQTAAASMETFEMNIKDLTYNQLQKLKIKPTSNGNDQPYDFEAVRNRPLSQPFASLKTVLESVESDCGFNVEIKYPQRKINGVWESEKSHDLNEYVDLILRDLFLYANERNIIISSFHPEICSLARLKQDRYPILFLTQGLSSKYVQFENPLNQSIEMATYLAVCMSLYGIAVDAEDIIKDRQLIKFVKSKSLVLFCWGDDLNDPELIKNLKKAGVDGAIYDKIDLLASKCKMIMN